MPKHPATPISVSDAPDAHTTEDAILVIELRKLWRAWEKEYNATTSEQRREVYRKAMADLEQTMAAFGDRKKTWEVVCDELAEALADRMTRVLLSLMEEKSRLTLVDPDTSKDELPW